MNKNICNFRNFEFIIQVFILIVYLLANLFYYRTFHYISFFVFFILCIKNGYNLVKSKKDMIPKNLCKEWKIMYPLYFILLAFLVARILWKISFYEISIMSYIAMMINLTFPFLVAVCLLIGEIRQRKLEQKEGIRNQYIHTYIHSYFSMVYYTAIYCFFHQNGSILCYHKTNTLSESYNGKLYF